VIVKLGLAGMLIAASFLQAASIAASEEAQAWIASPLPSVAVRPPGGDSQETRDIISQVSRTWFKAEWRAYASTFITPDGRIIDNANGGESHSEGQGYGLLLAAVAEDAEQFQLIWSWTDKHMRVRPDHLLSWKWDPQKGAIADKNNATDGDILIAWALAEGARRFARPDYLEQAKVIAQAIGAQTIRSTENGLILLPAASGFAREDQPDGPVINLSYWVFPAFAVLKELAPVYDWEGLRENGLKLLAQSHFGPLRLPADWQSVDNASTAPAKNFPAQFGYNAIRIPLYLAWSGGEPARRALRRFVSLWHGKHSVGPYVIDVVTGSTGQELDAAGYRLVLALARCAALGQPIDGDLVRSRDHFYYPETLRLLSLAVVQERYPQCL
jgi:endo-1,4-beta-D-glucanase Y